MIDRDLLSLSLRASGIVWLFRLLPKMLPTTLSIIRPDQSWISAGAHRFRIIGSEVIGLIIIICLLFFADAITRFVIKDEKELSWLNWKEWSTDIFGLAIKFIGVITALSGMNNIFYAVVSAMRVGEKSIWGFSNEISNIVNWSICVQYITMIILGVLLTAYAKQIVDVIPGKDHT